MEFITKYLAWAWIIVIGGLMLTPGGEYCIVCGRGISFIAGIINIAVGVIGIVAVSRQRG